MNHINTHNTGLKGNIWKLNLYMLFYGLLFYTPILVLFFQDNGLSFMQIMILESLSALLFVLCEVPSGFYADVYGRKNALLLTAIFSTIAMLSFALGTEFLHFLFAGVFWALAGVFVSGADSALLYDTLLDIEQEESFKKQWGTIVFNYSISVAVASFIGGFLADFDYRYTFFAIIPFMVLLIPIALSIKEPKRHKNAVSYSVSDLFSVVRSTLSNNKLRWLLFYTAVLICFFKASYLFSQPYFELSGVPIIYFGIIFAGLRITSAFSAKFAHKIEELIGGQLSLLLLSVVIGGCFLLMGTFVSLMSVLLVFLIEAIVGMSSVITTDAIHKSSTSEIRATIQSLRSLLGRLLFVVLTPFLGWFADVYSLTQALLLSGGFVLVAGVLLFALYTRDR